MNKVRVAIARREAGEHNRIVRMTYLGMLAVYGAVMIAAVLLGLNDKWLIVVGFLGLGFITCEPPIIALYWLDAGRSYLEQVCSEIEE